MKTGKKYRSGLVQVIYILIRSKMNNLQYLFLSNQEQDNTLHLYSKNITSSHGIVKCFDGFARTLPNPVCISNNSQLGLLSLKLLPPKDQKICIWNEFGNQNTENTILYINSNCVTPSIWNTQYKNVLYSILLKNPLELYSLNVSYPLYHKMNKQIINAIEITFTNQKNDPLYFEESLIIELGLRLNLG